jgi:ribosomal protein L37E
MSQVKHELHRIAEQEKAQLGKNCERCGNPVSYKDYAVNDGLCSYCKDGFEKMEKEKLSCN